MKNWYKYPALACEFLLITLWVYAAVSKLSDFQRFQMEMRRQVFPTLLQQALMYSLPAVELLVAAMLVIRPLFGLYSSLILLFLFTGYITATLLHFFKRVPCSCGGILTSMGWGTHLVFNLFFIALSLSTIYIIKRKEAS